MKNILNQKGSTLFTVIAMVGVIGAGAYFLPDVMKGSKKSIVDLENKMRMNQFKGQIERFFGTTEICVDNLSPTNLNQVDAFEWELKELRAVDMNGSIAQIAKSDDNVAKGKGYLKYKKAKLHVDKNSEGNTYPNHFDARIELVFETRDFGKKKLVSSMVPLSILSVEVDSVGSPIKPYKYEADGRVVSCNGVSSSKVDMSNMCKTLFGATYNKDTGQCDYVLVTDEPCIEYDNNIVLSTSRSYNSNRRKCMQGGSETPLGYHINIAPRGCGKGLSDPECQKNKDTFVGSLRVNNEFEVDGVKLVYCPNGTPAGGVAKPAWLVSQKEEVCKKFYDGTDPASMSGVLAYNLKSLRAKDIVADEVYATGYFRLSDIKSKYEIKPISKLHINSLRSKIKPMEYTMDGEKQFGFIAQDVEKIYPDIVTDAPRFGKSLNYLQFVPLMVSNLKEDSKKIDELKAKLERLENVK